MAVEQGKLKTPEENYEDAALELALYRMLRHEHEMVNDSRFLNGHSRICRFHHD